MLPFEATVLRREPDVGLEYYPTNQNVRLPVNVYPHDAPDPVRDSDFWAEGKPMQHAWAYASRFISTNIPGILSIDAWPADGFRIAKYIRSNIVRTPLGSQAAFQERVNIERASSAPYGSLASLNQRPMITVTDLR